MNKPAALLSLSLALGGCTPPESEPKTPRQPSVIVAVETTPSAVGTPKAPEHKPVPTAKNPNVDPAKKEKLDRLFAEQNGTLARINQAAPQIFMECVSAANACGKEQEARYHKVIPPSVLKKCPLYSLPEDTCVDDEMVKIGKIDQIIKLYQIGNRCLDQVETCIKEKNSTQP